MRIRLAVTRLVVISVCPLLAAGCATREWVREVVAERDARLAGRVQSVEQRQVEGARQGTQLAGRLGEVEGRVGGVEGRVAGVTVEVGQQGQRLDAVGTQVQGLEAAVGRADQRARSAQDRADTAAARAGSVDSRLGRLWSGRYAGRVADVVDVYFSLGQAELSDSAQTELLRVVRELQAYPTLSVELHGFTDPSGGRELNFLLSQRRVESVRRFLARQGISLGRIQAVVQGPIADRGVTPDKKRRVTVKLLVDGE